MVTAAPHTFWQTQLHAFPALSLPILVLGGIYSGIVGIVEASALAALLAIALSVGIYKGCTARDIIPLIAKSMRSSASILVIVSFAFAFSHAITELQIPQQLLSGVMNTDMASWQFLLLVNLIMLLLGMFLEPISLILLTLPILLPILQAFEISLIHYAIIVTINMELAMLTPPVGLNLYILSGVSGASLAETIRGAMPFILILLALLLLVTFVPELSLWLPGELK